MDVYEAIRLRLSTREYLDDAVDPHAVQRILDAAYAAPSGANASPWHYVVVDDMDVRRKIREMSEAVDSGWNQNMPSWFRRWLDSQQISAEKKFLEQAPCLIVVFSDNRLPYSVESTWMSIAFAVLAATAERLATLTYTPGDPSFLSHLLGTPEHLVPQAILPLGHPAEHPDGSTRPKKPAPRYGRQSQN